MKSILLEMLIEPIENGGLINEEKQVQRIRMFQQCIN